jgi:hypothetical protein
MQQFLFLPIAIFGVTGFTIGAISAWIEHCAAPQPRPPQKFRPVLVHDKAPASLLRSPVKRPAPRHRHASPIRLVVNGG